jgi:hypothetical protein
MHAVYCKELLTIISTSPPPQKKRTHVPKIRTIKYSKLNTEHGCAMLRLIQSTLVIQIQIIIIIPDLFLAVYTCKSDHRVLSSASLKAVSYVTDITLRQSYYYPSDTVPGWEK